MSELFTLCCALSVGVVVGFLGGGLKMRARANKPERFRYSEEQYRKGAALRKGLSRVLSLVTMAMLALGFIWCMYYLVLGAMDASQAEYATAMSQLIVSVLTIVSIVFAFSEFLRASFRRDAEERLAEADGDATMEAASATATETKTETEEEVRA